MVVPSSNLDRRWELDWLRVSAIVLLVFFHTGKIFDTEPWHIKNDDVTGSNQMWMTFLSSWRMPLLFFISGAGSYFTFQNSSVQHYAIERFMRLVVPFIFAIIIILPPQAYYEHKSEFTGYLDVYRSFFDYIPYHDGNRALYHIWFIAYLILYSVIGIPFLVWLRSDRSKKIKARLLPLMFKPIGLVLAPLLAIVIPRLLLFPGYQEPAFFVFYLSFFLFGAVYYHDPAYRDRIASQRKLLLGLAILSVVVFRITYGIPVHSDLLTYLTLEPVHESMRALVSWFWVMALIGYAQHYLQRPSQRLLLANEGIYSLYILHQTVIVVIGYYICQLPWGITVKFLSIVAITLLLCSVLFVWVIKPYAPLRILFGIKSKSKQPKAKPAYVRSGS